MKKIWPIIVVLALAHSSCNLISHRSYEDFINHLEQTKSFGTDTILLGWRGWSRYDGNCNYYHLWYDKGGGNGEFCYMNAYKVETGEVLFEPNSLDTLSLCKCMGIEKDSFQSHIKSVCMHVHNITRGYCIWEWGFYRNGEFVFLSDINGWGIVYLKDTCLNNNESQKIISSLDTSGYDRIENTNYWVHTFVPDK